VTVCIASLVVNAFRDYLSSRIPQVEEEGEKGEWGCVDTGGGGGGGKGEGVGSSEVGRRGKRGVGGVGGGGSKGARDTAGRGGGRGRCVLTVLGLAMALAWSMV
ncbi:hypothetical protein Taro_046309, partial [Colocasia esculenta]|nr:hypothetical protein [Colocasia esculenta]